MPALKLDAPFSQFLTGWPAVLAFVVRARRRAEAAREFTDNARIRSQQRALDGEVLATVARRLRAHPHSKRDAEAA